MKAHSIFNPTQVGTQGYTAPEILGAKHYGTAADIFSFAVVMSEVVTLRRPYSDMQRDQTDMIIVPWSKIVQMTIDEGLRPTLPQEIDPEMKALIEDCWEENPALRPSATVVTNRLRKILVKIGAGDTGEFKQVLSGLRDLDSSAKLERMEKIVDTDEAVQLCTSLSALLFKAGQADELDSKIASKIISPSATASSTDTIVDALLRELEGTPAMIEVGRMIYSGLSGREATIEPEPLLKGDILYEVKTGLALVTLRFAQTFAPVNAPPKAPPNKTPRGMAGLEAALAEATESQKDVALAFALSAAGDKKKARLRSARQRPRSELKRKLKKKTKKNELPDFVASLFETFIKASRFVRFSGAEKIPPSATVALTALFLQAQNGDYAKGKADSIPVGATRSSRCVHKASTAAWTKVQGKSRVECMKEYGGFDASRSTSHVHRAF